MGRNRVVAAAGPWPRPGLLDERQTGRATALTAEPKQPLGPALLFGLEPARGVGEQQLTELVEQALPARFSETGRGEPSEAVMERAREELRAIRGSDLADLLLFAHDVGRFCAERGIPLAARGSATSSLVVWALGLSELCPLDYGRDGRMLCHEGRDDHLPAILGLMYGLDRRRLIVELKHAPIMLELVQPREFDAVAVGLDGEAHFAARVPRTRLAAGEERTVSLIVVASADSPRRSHCPSTS